MFNKLFYFLYTYSLCNSSLIKPVKICKDCKFYMADKSECKLFGDINLVDGKINYDYAFSVRLFENKCGKEAKYFEENKLKIITIPYYFIKSYYIIILFVGLFTYILNTKY